METKENIEIYSALKTAPVNYDHQYYSQELFKTTKSNLDESINQSSKKEKNYIDSICESKRIYLIFKN